MKTDFSLNKNPYRSSLITTYFFLFLIISSSFMFINSTNQSDPLKNGYVPNEATAIKIAEAIWLPIYGEEIYKHKPFKAVLLKNQIWRVTGTVHTKIGGGPIAEIQKSDCKVLKIIHEK